MGGRGGSTGIRLAAFKHRMNPLLWHGQSSRFFLFIKECCDALQKKGLSEIVEQSIKISKGNLLACKEGHERKGRNGCTEALSALTAGAEKKRYVLLATIHSIK